jgi:hypothetical protein
MQPVKIKNTQSSYSGELWVFYDLTLTLNQSDYLLSLALA